ncbi:MAG TPA: PH domain-containing protein [Clostridiales bacterium]|nr:PH domain-containing protein [Clostridiales bacterium]HOL79317.1 PH domain-containing protein [Clostridiales bacterium]HPP67786.1 PH domain-containing protein [Clostridiales bacterium]
MASVSSGILGDANLMNLKEMSVTQVRPEVNSLLVSDEEIIQCFKTIRDQVIFTNKRVLVVNVQGVTGKKVAYFSYPYSKVQYFGVETAGLLDIDSELILAFNDGNRLQFDFKAQVDIARICSIISSFVL